MHILITGATGFIGSALVHRLQKTPYKLTALVRTPCDTLPMSVQQITTLSNLRNLDQFDAVINLAGEPIFAKPWTTQQKVLLTQSRIELTQQLVSLINASEHKPTCFISASATGYYGVQGDNWITEANTVGKGFSATLCEQWENTALQAETRTCLLRTGLVLSHSGGMLAKIRPLYRWGLGGKLGAGTQYWSWIALEDMCEIILFLLHNPQCDGAFNCVSPTPIQQREFNRLFAHSLNRPAFAHAPAFMLKLLLGERAELLLNSQRIMPEKLQQQGFQFKYGDLRQVFR